MRTSAPGSSSATVAGLLALLVANLAYCAQIPLQSIGQGSSDQQTTHSASASPERPLFGRFLQITDLHPDRFYETYSATGEGYACHRGSGPAGYYGAETSDCDSPISLINATFDWIEKELKDSIDFVIWTGDSARHDNDEKLPRNSKQVVGLNRMVAEKFEQVFGRRKDDKDPFNDLIIPIVPNIGNNDILPHNIFSAGSNTWTMTYLDIWRTFIPEEQRHQFDQGGWFSVEVIPNHLHVFSLNSLYFFDNNAAVDGCSLRSEPGYRQLEWLRIRLQYLRERNMKAMLIGHVPPARTADKQSWDETCWQKYTLWMRQYRDVIVGSFYGHMNYDHFMLQDFEDIDPALDEGYGVQTAPGKPDEEVRTESAASYFTGLRDSWSTLPQRPRSVQALDSDERTMLADQSDDARPDWEIEALVKGNKGKKGDHKKKKDPTKKVRKYLNKIGGEYGERYSVSHVSPSVVPNFFPTIRVYEYNITGLDRRRGSSAFAIGPSEESASDVAASKKKKKHRKDKKKNKKRKKVRFNVPKPPSKSAPPGPAYSPQTLSLLGITQYYANLTRINNDFVNTSGKREQVETTSSDLKGQKWNEGKHKHHNGEKPKEDTGPHPTEFSFEVLYNTRGDDEYGLKDLTVRSYIELAQRIGKKVKSRKSEAEEVEEGSGAYEKEALSSQDGVSGTVPSIVAGDEKIDKEGQKKKKKHKGAKANKYWIEFLRRAFCGARNTQEIRDQFGP